MAWPTSRVFEVLFLIALFLPSSRCNPTPSRGQNTRWNPSHLQIRQDGYFPVLGVPGVGDSIPHPRLEIRELEKNPEQWNVYLLGLARLQSKDQNDKLSYYQLAGIHGKPYMPWDGVGQGPSNSGGGYCPHGSNLFPTWHRPYLSLVEQVLHLNAREAISEFPDGTLKETYTRALQSFRMPYWDWAAQPSAGSTVLPLSVQRPRVTLVVPNGTVTVDNPLYSYRFHPLNTTDFDSSPFDVFPSTVRDPSSDHANAASRNDLVGLVFEYGRANFQSRVYNILTMEHNYTIMSNDRSSRDSLEAIHNTVHTNIGGGGHMTNPAYSAYDPIFWLHHADVDRLFAIWQALNPTEYVTPVANPYVTFTTPENFVADANTPLTPFHRSSNGEFWTSESVRSVETFAYTYPELMGVTSNRTSDLMAAVNALYGPAAAPANSSVAVSRRLRRAILGAPTFEGKRRYTTRVRMDRRYLRHSVNVYVFLGEDDVTGSPIEWMRNDGFVGVVGVVALDPSLRQTSQAGPNEEEELAGGVLTSNSEVPLTAALEEKIRSGQLESMREDVVREYLRRSLKWKVAQMDHEEVDVKGLEVDVMWAKVRPPRSEREFPSLVGENKVLCD
ncbi:Di-copper centre-containing protein [Sporormia fimetaria CBS 119925]|uniref:tyrosinase n=1 Tax=Sporormia fimetaria CBS 119925 TaxID=1340428 RepID=A0A6A6V9C0_9PLEO|nr:Di-copper centre-containing protein [Sporormia fimetaria CBS 119925]